MNPWLVVRRAAMDLALMWAPSRAAIKRMEDRAAREALRAANEARDLKEWAKAAIFYSEFTRLRPESWGAWAQLGHVLKESGDLTASEQAYRAGLKFEDRGDVSLHLGRLLRRMGRDAEAVQILGDAAARYRNAELDAELLATGFSDRLPAFHPLRSEHGRDLSRVGAALAATTQELQRWLTLSTYPVQAFDAFQKNFPVSPPPAESEGEIIVIVDARYASPVRLRATLMSLFDQSHPQWRVVVLPSAEIAGHPVASLSAVDPRVTFSSPNSTRAPALPAETAELVLLDAGVVLHPFALAWMTFAAHRTGAAAVYVDHDRLTEDWREGLVHFNAVLQASPDPVGLRTTPSPPIAVLFRRNDGYDNLLLALGRRQDVSQSLIRMLVLERIATDRVCHVPRVLASQFMINESASGSAIGPAEEIPGYTSAAASQSLALPQSSRADAISVIIPTRDQAGLLAEAVRTLIAQASQPQRLDIVVVDNGSRLEETRDLLNSLTDQGVRVLDQDMPFNWSHLNNIAAAACDSDILVFANNDIEMLTPGWDDIVRDRLAMPEIGIVGAKLLYPDLTLQHAGMVLGIGRGAPMHEGVGVDGRVDGPEARWSRSRSAAAVTGAFMAVRAEVHRAVAGFEERDLAIAYNDVDYCLRVRRGGWLVAYVAEIEAIHHESKTRGFNDTQSRVAWDEAELASVSRYWGEGLVQDPSVNPQWASNSRQVFDGYQEPSLARILQWIDDSARFKPWAPSSSAPVPIL